MGHLVIHIAKCPFGAVATGMSNTLRYRNEAVRSGKFKINPAVSIAGLEAKNGKSGSSSTSELCMMIGTPSIPAGNVFLR